MKIMLIIAMAVSGIILFNAVVALASDSVSGLLKTTGDTAQYDTGKTDLTVVAGQIIQIFLSFLGIIFVALIVYAGYLWMTASGEADKVDKAKQLLKQAIIGLVIIIASYAITYFILASLAKDYIKDSGF